MQTMDDGSAQLQMSNGSTISVPAADVQIADGAGSGQRPHRRGGGRCDGSGARAGQVAGPLPPGLPAVPGWRQPPGAAAVRRRWSAPTPVLNDEDFQSRSSVSAAASTTSNTGIEVPEDTSSVDVTITDEDGEEIHSTCSLTKTATGRPLKPTACRRATSR